MHFMPIGPTTDRESALVDKPDRKEYERFYTTYGECFSAWSVVELSLLSIYVLLLSSPEYKAATATFYSTTGFRAKLDMVDAVINNSTQVVEDDLKTWKPLFEKTSKKALRRNELAHNTVYFGRLSEVGKKTMFIADPQTPREGSQLHTHDLAQIRESFIDLRMELLSFWHRLISKMEQKPQV
jgi:hypothetical protein